MKTCLLITEQFEPSADLIIAELRRRGVPCLRFNLDSYPAGSSLTYRVSNAGFGATIVSDGRAITLDEISGIWCRGFRPAGFPAGLNANERNFAETESKRALDALLTVKPGVWINHPYRSALANSKPAQLFAARETGFEIAETVVTNDPDTARAFAGESAEPVIFKTLSQSLETPDGEALFTGIVTDVELANIDAIRVAPGIFQRRVPKAYELRVTVVGERIFAARIDSQARSDTALDWRRAALELEYSAIELPPDIAAKTQALMRKFGLVYGAMDFIVTPDNRHVFLELNPSGQYMWIETKTGLPITAALADMLMR